MIRNRKTEQQIPIDFLRLLYNRSLILSIITLINGHGQIGKSTALFYICCRNQQIKKGISLSSAKWNEWDYKKYTATSPRQFVELWDSSENEDLALEEAGEQMNYLEFWNTMSRVFSSTTRTQGLKKNRCYLITPFSRDISKYNRECVDFKVWVRRRDDVRRLCGLRPRYIKIDYLKDKYKLGYLKDWNIFYTKKFLKEAKKYTDHLKQYKRDISEKNKRIVGLIPTKNNLEKMTEIFEKQLKEKDTLKPIKITL